ncbi:MAG TPA: two-component regulator propeller domain-containing protein [Bryobacteraceae bacterium]|jgi:ligand-binding sensor domain-containing protein/signal transduction histidine kinase
MKRGSLTSGVLVFAALSSLSPAALALDADRSIDQFFHTSWTVKDGAPTGLTRITQTTDGYLWLATQTGLVRFDGIRFTRFEPSNGRLPSNSIASLLPTADGGLWIGFVPNGAAFLKNGRIVSWTQREGLPAAPVYAIGLDGEGTVWAGTSRGLWRFENSRWTRSRAESGFPDTTVNEFYLDREKCLWVSTLDGLFYLPLHGHRFERVSSESPLLAQTAYGRFWMSDNQGLLRPFSRNADRALIPAPRGVRLDATQLLLDRDNTLWIMTRDNGIVRMAHPDDVAHALDKPLQHFTLKDGLTDDRVTAAFEDREGNIWAATRNGLDRFRPKNVFASPFPYGDEGWDLALVSDTEGAVWAGNLGQSLMRLKDNRLSRTGGVQRITCAYRDPSGVLWFGGESSLAKVIGGRLQSARLPPQIDLARGWVVQAITADKTGALWISVQQNGVFKLENGVWAQYGDVPALPRRTAVSMFTDPRGRIWLGYTGNALAVLDNARVQTFSAPDGLETGMVTAMAWSHGRLWVGGEFGLGFFDGARFHMISSENDSQFRGVSGIVATSGGDLWLNQAPGVTHIARSEIDAVIGDTRHRLDTRVFDFRDGVSGLASPVRPVPSAIQSSDGRIWVSGTTGVSWIDPSRIYLNRFPPPVSIESIAVDGRTVGSGSAAELPVSPFNVRIDYTALSLSVPERVRFRYRLEGFERDWQDAGTRRTAFYTKLGPGHYRFHVIASNNDGVWNTEGGTAEIVVPPAYFQTTWFAILCVSAAAGCLWILYLLRMRQVAAQMQSGLNERLAERERIARELHDTLLQGIQGMILRLQGAANRISPNEPARHMMEDALDAADAMMAEGRERVRDLRAHSEAPGSLAEAFSAVAAQLSGDGAYPAFRVVLEGDQRELTPLVRDELYRIGREALVNAFAHAHARLIEAELVYRPHELQLHFRDDGSGIDPIVLTAGGRPGHWGLTGMRERAKRLGAAFEIRSRAGAGTEIDLKVSATVAYTNTASSTFLRRVLRIKSRTKTS